MRKSQSSVQGCVIRLKEGWGNIQLIVGLGWSLHVEDDHRPLCFLLADPLIQPPLRPYTKSSSPAMARRCREKVM